MVTLGFLAVWRSGSVREVTDLGSGPVVTGIFEVASGRPDGHRRFPVVSPKVFLPGF